MALEKINYDSAEVKVCRHSEQPDVPKRSAAETKEFFDSMSIKILIPKINEIVDELPKKADADKVYTKTDADALLGKKADADEVYSKTDADALFDKKANADKVYTKTEIDKKLASLGGGSIAKSEFVDLFEIFFGGLTDRKTERVVALRFPNQEYSSTCITLKRITEGMEDAITVHIVSDYAVFEYQMSDVISTVYFRSNEVINLIDVLDVLLPSKEHPDDGLYLEDAEMGVYGQVLFDGIASISTAASMLKKSQTEIPEIKIAEKKRVEIGDDISHICANEGYPDVEIDVTVTFECGQVYSDTIRYCLDAESYDKYISSQFYTSLIGDKTRFDNGEIFLYQHYEMQHTDSEGGACFSRVKSIIVDDVRYGDMKGDDTYVITTGFMTFAEYSRLI